MFLVHGWGGWPEEGWFPDFKQKLKQKGFEVIIPEMPNSENPQMSLWLPHLISNVGEPNEQTFFIGHSLGNITILRYLEQLKPNQRVGGCVFVAGFTDDLGITELKDSLFFKDPIDFEKSKKRCSTFIAIHSDNDKYVDVTYGDIFKKQLGAEVIILPNMHHFSGGDGIKELPEACSAILKISTST